MIAFNYISGFCLLCYLLNNWTDYPTKFVEQLVYATAKFQYPNDLGCRSKVSFPVSFGVLRSAHLPAILSPCKRFVCLFCCFTSQVNSYGHGGTVSSPNHTFSWVELNQICEQLKQIVYTRAYFWVPHSEALYNGVKSVCPFFFYANPNMLG